MVHHRLHRRPAVLLALGALVATSTALAAGASATTTTTTTTTTYRSDCAAQLVALSLGGNPVPLDAGRTCGKPGDSFVPTDTIVGPAQFPFVVNVLYENTSRSADQSQAQARAGVAHVYLPLGVASGNRLPDVTLDVLTGESRCSNGTTSGSSHVVGLKVGGTAVELPYDATKSPIPLGPLGSIEVNQVETSSGTVSDTGADSNPRVVVTDATRKDTALHVVLLPGQAPGGAAVVDLTVAQTSVSCQKTETTTTTGGGGGGGNARRWMTGGGTMTDSSSTTVDPGTRVSHGFVLPCVAGQTPPGGSNLKVNGDFGRFTLTSVDESSCTYDHSRGAPEQPNADFNTMDGKGTGTCNGDPKATVQWHFTDEGEPNTADEAVLHIRGTNCSLDVTGVLTNGNNQAHGDGTSSSKRATRR